MRITSKGQVTIPVDIRERAGLLPETEVEFDFDGKLVTIRKVRRTERPGRGARMVARLRRQGDIKMTTDETMALMRGR
jgi:AbrB family looped-hinge helix DNA binding protein